MKPGQVQTESASVLQQPGPEAYFEEMGRLQYRLPDVTKIFYRAIVRRLERSFNRPIEVVDLGSSYGINPAVMNYGFTMDELTAYFLERDRSPGDYAEARTYFRTRGPDDPALRFHLIDEQEPAVRFSRLLGLCEDAFALDMEESVPRVASADTPEARFWRMIARADLFISTGRVGYLTEETFERLFHIRREMTSREETSLPGLRRAPRPLFAFSLVRHFASARLQGVFERHGFELIRANLPPIPQRRFRSDDEREQVFRQLSELGLDPGGLEDTGFLHAHLYFGGPAEESTKLHNFLHGVEVEFKQEARPSLRLGSS